MEGQPTQMHRRGGTVTMRLFLTALAALASLSAALHLGPFESAHYVAVTAPTDHPHPSARRLMALPETATFIVALQHRHVDTLKQELFAVSDPRHARYGQHRSAAQVRATYAPLPDDAQRVVTYFQGIADAAVVLNTVGTMLQVTASVAAIEAHLDTALAWHVHADNVEHLAATLADNDPTDAMLQRFTGMRRALRATRALAIPADVAAHVAFVRYTLCSRWHTRPGLA